MTSFHSDNAQQAILVAALTDPGRYPHPVDAVKRLETHISHVLLAGRFAYKIKKPLNLGFLDFTSLERRRYYCEEELRLNRRLAPELYLECVPIGGSPEKPEPGGRPAIEYAVRMRRFPQSALLERCLSVLEPRHLDALARRLAAFHGEVAGAAPASPFGSPALVRRQALDNFADCRRLLDDRQDQTRLAELEDWTRHEHRRLEAVLAGRKRTGRVRECHGDLHLGNLILYEDRVIAFDGIEFDEALRWIDTMADLAFLIMDLHRRNAAALAWRLLNGYLEAGGDYPGLAVLPFYLTYRAMVRAKIAAIRTGQAEGPQRPQECRRYLDLAQGFTRRPAPFLLITHGVSGSGKSFLTARLQERLGAIRLRSDVERKRLFGLEPGQRSGSAPDRGLYTAEAGARTYERLLELAARSLDAGFAVLVDATFLEAQRRQRFRALAARRGVPFVLLACAADPATLRARVAERLARGDDPAEADPTVLEKQLAHDQPPGPEEDPLTAGDGGFEVLAAAVLARVGRPSGLR